MPKKSGKGFVEAILKRYPRGLDRNQIKNVIFTEFGKNYNTRTIADTYCEELIEEKVIVTKKERQKIIYIHRDAEKEKIKDFLYNPFMKTHYLTDIMIIKYVCQKYLKNKVEELEEKKLTFPGYNYRFFLEIIHKVVNDIDNIFLLHNRNYIDDKIYKRAATGFLDYTEYLIKWFEEFSVLIRKKHPFEILKKESRIQKLKKILKFFSILENDLKFIRMTPAFSEDIEISPKSNIKLSKGIYDQIIKRIFLQKEIYDQMDCPEDLSFDLSVSYRVSSTLTDLKYDDFNKIKDTIKDIFGISKPSKKIKHKLLSEGYAEDQFDLVEKNRIYKIKLQNRVKKNIIHTLNQYYFEKEKELVDYFNIFKKYFGRYDLVLLLNSFNDNIQVPYFIMNKVAVKSIVEDVFIIDIPIDDMLSDIEMVRENANWTIEKEIEERKKFIDKAFQGTITSFDREIKKKMIEKLKSQINNFKNLIRFYLAKKGSRKNRIYT